MVARTNSNKADFAQFGIDPHPHTLAFESSNLLHEKPPSATQSAHATLSRACREFGAGIGGTGAQKHQSAEFRSRSPAISTSAMLHISRLPATLSQPHPTAPLGRDGTMKMSHTMEQTKEVKKGEQETEFKSRTNGETRSVSSPETKVPKDVQEQGSQAPKPVDELSRDKNKASTERDESPESSAPRH
jgi:hypothetical protein